MSDADKMKPPSLWVPISDAEMLAVLGKLNEELNEAGTAVARCIIQGMDGVNPDGGQVNREWLEDELADVKALTGVAVRHFNLDVLRMQHRALKKIAHKEEWVRMLVARRPCGWVIHWPDERPEFTTDSRRAQGGSACGAEVTVVYER